MPGIVTLRIIEGAMQGTEYVFTKHDTFLFGRKSDCHACLPNDDYVSRHHFILEANPPDARIRDLGSLNGTCVNGIRYGGRDRHETPREGAQHHYPEVDLKDGDEITVGDTVFRVIAETLVLCTRCGNTFAAGNSNEHALTIDIDACPTCQKSLDDATKPAPRMPKKARCEQCGKDVGDEIGHAQPGDYICADCRQKIIQNPAELPIPDYEIKTKLGEGGMGAVFLAQHRRSGEQVALKVMLSRVAVDENSRKKFEREIESMRGLNHENVVMLYSHNSVGGTFYFLQEFCEGGCVKSLMNRRGGQLSLDEAGPIMLGALQGLSHIHANDIVHRDLKPANILLRGQEGKWVAKVGDLGLAKNFEQAGFSGMTATGHTGGTPCFMPREQVTNYKYVRPVTDVWAMGATFYNMLTGQYPHNFPVDKDPIAVILMGRIVPINERLPRIPKRVAEFIDCSLAAEPQDRFQDAGAMFEALEGIL